MSDCTCGGFSETCAIHGHPEFNPLAHEVRVIDVESHPWIDTWEVAGYVGGTFSTRALVSTCGKCGAMVKEAHKSWHEGWHRIVRE